MSRNGRAAELSWAAAGAGIFLGVALTAIYFHGDRRRTDETALRTRALAIVDQMRVDLASSSEAEKSSVLAITDEDSLAFADQARASRAAVERGRTDLASLLARAPDQAAVAERLSGFAQSFEDLRKIDDEVLSLAVRNTNLKASRLAMGPAAAALDEFEGALAHLAADAESSAGGLEVVSRADDARIRALRVQVLLPRHIAEESDATMDALEARMAEEGRALRVDLATLAPLRPGSADLTTAMAAWDRFSEIERSIVALSRENTNVRSLSLSLTRKRNALGICQDALAALRQAIEREPGTAHPPPTRPR